MGFFDVEQKVRPKDVQGLDVAFLHRLECKACPLNRERNLKHPHMEPTGTESPVVYLLGEAPGADEDAKGIQFIGKAGKLLRLRIPRKWNDKLRWNNVVRTRPPNNRTPEPVEIESCRPSIIRDIERTKPQAIFGFGAVPLQWALGLGGITQWCGRRIPIKVGKHPCWFYPMLHPSYVGRTRKFQPRHAKEYGSEIEFAFAVSMKRAFDDLDDLPEPIVHTEEVALADIEIIHGENGAEDLARIKEFLGSLDDPSFVVGMDYETNCLRPYKQGAKILTVSLAGRDGTLAFAMDHPDDTWSDGERDALWALFGMWLLEARCIKVVHQLAFEMEWSAYFFGRKVLRAQRWGDTIGQAYILDERQGSSNPGCLSLEFLCMQYFGINIKAISGVDRKKLETTPVVVVLCYNGMDSKYHRNLYFKQRNRLQAEGLAAVYISHLARVPTMVLTQLKGIPVSQKVVGKFYDRFTDDLKGIEADISKLKVVAQFKRETNKVFRPSANQDVRYALVELLGKKVETVDETVLVTIDHPLAELILEWRKVNKLLSTYVKPLRKGSPDLWPDGKIHPIISTTRTRTWRTSSSDPNEQNFPKRKDREIRGQIRAPVDWRIVSFDYGQIQARNVGMESLDAALVQAFWDRYDIHSDWTERIVGVYPRWVKEGIKNLSTDKNLFKHYRDRTKNEWVFPLFFGAQPPSLAKYLGIPERLCVSLSEEFWSMFSDVRGWQKRILEQYYLTGWVTGLTGFRRRAPISPNELINAPIQADEAMIVCDAMARLSQLGEPRYQANMEIHDDLTFVWPKREIERNAEVVIDHMLHVPFEWAHSVPIVVEMSVGQDWAELEEVGDFASDRWKGRLSDKEVAVFEPNENPSPRKPG